MRIVFIFLFLFMYSGFSCDLAGEQENHEKFYNDLKNRIINLEFNEPQNLVFILKKLQLKFESIPAIRGFHEKYTFPDGNILVLISMEPHPIEKRNGMLYIEPRLYQKIELYIEGKLVAEKSLKECNSD